MLSIRKKIDESSLLNDLIKINDGRIISYEQALNNSGNLDSDIIQLLNRIIENSKINIVELTDKLIKLNGKSTVSISGILFRAWMDLKAGLAGNSRSSVINFCLYNEEMALHTYNAAMNLSGTIDEEIKAIISHQQGALRQIYELIKGYKETRYSSNSRLVYFN